MHNTLAADLEEEQQVLEQGEVHRRDQLEEELDTRHLLQLRGLPLLRGDVLLQQQRHLNNKCYQEGISVCS